MTAKLTALLDEIEALEKALKWNYRTHEFHGPGAEQEKQLHTLLYSNATLLTGALRECIQALEKYEDISLPSASAGDYCTADINFIARETLARVRGMVEKK